MKHILTITLLIIAGFISCDKQAYEQETPHQTDAKSPVFQQPNSPVTESLETSRNTLREQIKAAKKMLRAQHRNDTLEIIILNPTREALRSGASWAKHK